MAYTVNVGDIVQIRLHSRLHNQTCINVFNYRIVVASDPDAGAAYLNTLIDRFDVQVLANLASQLSTDLTFETVFAQVVHPVRFVAESKAPVSNTGGTVAQESLPSSVAVVVKKTTDLAGKRFRGRNYFPGIPIAHESNSVLVLAELQNWDIFVANAIKDPLDDGAAQVIANPVIWSPAQPVSHFFVVSARTDPVLRNQRRRQVGRGI